MQKDFEYYDKSAGFIITLINSAGFQDEEGGRSHEECKEQCNMVQVECANIITIDIIIIIIINNIIIDDVVTILVISILTITILVIIARVIIVIALLGTNNMFHLFSH